MSDILFIVPDPLSRFFDNYLKSLKKHAMPEKQHPSYVKRVKNFIKAQNSRKIKLVPRQYLSRYFEEMGREVAESDSNAVNQHM